MTVYGPAARRAANPDGRLQPSDGVAVRARWRARSPQRGVFVSHGDFYAATVVAALGLGADGLVAGGLRLLYVGGGSRAG